MSPLASLLASSSSSPSASASSTVRTETTKQLAPQLAWKTALYLVVVLVIVSIIFGTISLIWNDPWQSSTTRQRGEKVEPERLESAIQLPSASMFVERMLRYFFQTLLPAFRHLRQATASSLPGAARPRSQPALPLFRPPGFQEPHLVAPRPAIPRDTSSFRVPSNPYTVAEPASLQALPAPSRPVFLGPGWGSGP